MIFKKLFFWIFIAFISIVCGLVVHNNYGNARNSNEEIQHAFNDSVDWIKQNRHQIEKVHNPMLWWMLGEAAYISHNDALEKVFTDYKTNNFDKYNHPVWSYFFLSLTLIFLKMK